MAIFQNDPDSEPRLRAAAISQLWALVRECPTANWDGYEAYPLSEVAAKIAEVFFRALPDNVPLPEFAGEPDGSISLDWTPNRDRFFGMSIGTTNRLAYAWVSGSASGHGVADFDGETVPPEIIDFIRMATEES